MLKKLERARKKAQGILDATDVSSREKQDQIKGWVKDIWERFCFLNFLEKWLGCMTDSHNISQPLILEYIKEPALRRQRKKMLRTLLLKEV